MMPENKSAMWSKERLTARAEGKTRFTGKICPRNPDHGHERFTINATCAKCHTSRSKARGIRNKSVYRQILQNKIQVFNHYGWVCSHCSVNDPDVLTIDHTNQDGAEHRKSSGANSHSRLYRWLKRNDFPAEFRTLCYNCNVKAWKAHSGQTFLARCEQYKPYNLRTISCK